MSATIFRERLNALCERAEKANNHSTYSNGMLFALQGCKAWAEKHSDEALEEEFLQELIKHRDHQEKQVETFAVGDLFDYVRRFNEGLLESFEQVIVLHEVCFSSEKTS